MTFPTEFTSRALDHWTWAHKVQLDFSWPGKPTDNAKIEAFNASVRRECLSEHYFSTLAEAAVVLALFRDEYNNHRPQSSLGQKTPAEIYAGTKTNVDHDKAPKPDSGVRFSGTSEARCAKRGRACAKAPKERQHARARKPASIEVADDGKRIMLADD